MVKERGKNLSQPVVDHLIEMLVTQQIKPGEIIAENKIALEFGISRTPVREALRKLESEGVITIYPNRHAQVVDIDDDFVQQLGQMRIAIDIMAIKLAIFYGSNADFQQLRALADACTEATKTGDHMLRGQSDNEFHNGLIKISRNRFLVREHKSLTLQVRLLLAWKNLHYNEGFNASQDHNKIVDALVARDEVRATRIAVEHLVKFYAMDERFPGGFFTKSFKDLDAGEK